VLNAFVDESFLIGFLHPLEYLEFIGSTVGVGKAEVNKYLTAQVDLVNEDILSGRKLIRDLSTGSKVRVGLLAALLGDPKYILLDEPFAHLDPSTQARLRRVIKQQHDAGRTVILSSHNLQNVMEVCTRVVLIEQGKVIADQKVDEMAHSQLQAYFEA